MWVIKIMIKLTTYVTDISSVMLLYSHIRVYTSDSESGTYTYLDDVLLIADQSIYYYNHTAGTTDTWYKVSYYNTTTEAESGLSNAASGEEPVLYHTATYPEEYEFTAAEKTLIRKIRRYIGDLKGLDRLYLNNEDTFCSSIQDDNKTVTMPEKGWPVYISLNEVEQTHSSNPVVQGYRHLTFSGTLNINNDTLDIWYYTFKFSDVEVYRAYDDALVPPGLTSDTVTQDHLILVASISLLEHMTWEDLVEDGGTIRDDRSLYDPSPGLRERDAAIKRLQKQLDDLIKQYIMLGIGGVLID